MTQTACQIISMLKKTRYIRIALAIVGLWTSVSSFLVIRMAIPELSGAREDALSDVSMVILLLGILLAIGGACLAQRGIKYQSDAT